MPMIFIFWGFCTGSGQQISTLVFGSLYGATIVSAVDPLDERWGVEFPVGSGAATDRVLGEFAGREKKKETSLLPFFQVFFTCSKRNRTWSSEICVTDRNHYAKRSKPACKFVTSSRPTDRLFSSHPAPDPHWEFVRPRRQTTKAPLT